MRSGRWAPVARLAMPTAAHANVASRRLGFAPRGAATARHLARGPLCPDEGRRLRTRRCRWPCGASEGDRSFQDLARELEDLDNSGLHSFLQRHRDRVTLEFLNWLSESSHSNGHLWSLGGRLLAAREGLEPVSHECLRDAVGQQVEEKLGPASSELFMKQSAPLTVEGLQAMERQARELESLTQEARRRSVTQIVGRKRLNDGNMTSVSGLDVADRILDVLVELDSSADLNAALVDAITPADAEKEPQAQRHRGTAGGLDDHVPEGVDEGSSPDTGGGSDTQEFLSTTPFQLLRVIDSRLAQMACEDGDGAAEKKLERLRELRTGVIKNLENAMGTRAVE
ncbi:unnamed protein product [Ostreobium quekettii]|uniref:Uncharacterized protein n=1 Tax=Ostreobium quekettii TaxID=121088 RepID=A0A8S1IV39_9CHLO|nr:unnamed protein product [Ostreobium quekettii]|eukprot:evm.model.scf_13EXC.13 EVM.evm.TU.scf_13EXC.13   scf_13EXC:185489-189116(+)